MICGRIPRERASIAALCLAAVLLVTAVSPAWGAGEPDYASRIGVFYKCLSIRNPALEPGTPVTIIWFRPKGENFAFGDTRDRRVEARILAKTDSTQDCLSEIEERKSRYRSDEFTLYTVAPVRAGDLDPVEIGIGVVGIGPEDTNPIDLDGEGVPDYFGTQSGLASLTFYVWSVDPIGKEPFEPLWSARYVFGVGALRIPPPLGARVGWMSECLVIHNPDLQPGTPVTLQTIGDLSRFSLDRVLDLRLTGRIVEKTNSEETCALLADDKRAVMEAHTASFYTVALDDGPFMNPNDGIFGIAIVGPPPLGAFDLDDNGAADSFTACQHHEGIGFEVWSGEPYAGEPSWSDYFYFGYDTDETECPVETPSSAPELWEPTSEWLPVFRFGWVFGGCVFTSNDQLESGTPIAIVTREVGDEDSGILKKRLLAKVLGQGGTGEDCPGLSAQLREWNQFRGELFYPIGLEDDQPIDPHMFGIGIILPGPEGQAFDLDDNGRPDGFSVCYGERGNMNFLAWVGEPLIGATAEAEALSSDEVGAQLIWGGTLYIDGKFAGTPDCPAGFW
jgi:hypothetical protein